MESSDLKVSLNICCFMWVYILYNENIFYDYYIKFLMDIAPSRAITLNASFIILQDYFRLFQLYFIAYLNLCLYRFLRLLIYIWHNDNRQ